MNLNGNMPKQQTTVSTFFPIRILSEKTSVGASTLRAWERRYGLLQPERTPKGHRLYNEADAQKVFKILNLLDDGHSLPVIAEMLSIETQGQTAVNTTSHKPDHTHGSSMSSIWQDFIQATLDAVYDFNIERIDTNYNEASSLYPVDLITDRLIQPILAILGEAWKKHPEKGIAQEHFYSSWLKNRLGSRFHHAYANAKGTRIVCACVPGSYHEMGLMLFSISALARGYRVLYFGANLPFDQLHHISQRSAAKAVVLSAQNNVTEGINEKLPKLITELKSPVFMGGTPDLIDTDKFQAAGGILLGEKISVALRVFESHVPAYPQAAGTGRE